MLTPNEIRENEFDDLEICKLLKEKFRDEKRVMLNTNIEIKNLLNLISESKFIITSRFHLMVFSLILKKPPIVISWSEKYNDIMSFFKIEKYCLDSSDKAVNAILDLIKNYEETCLKINKNLEINSRQINKSLKIFLNLINY